MVRRVAVLSLHTSPLAQPGQGDGGGMNVYVRSLAAALARAGIEGDLLTRGEGRVPRVVEAEPGVRVVHLPVGPVGPVAKGALLDLHDDFVDAAADWLTVEPADVLHAHYWVSGAVAHTLKHRLGVPMVTTFHTLARAKQAVGIDDDPDHRFEVEASVVRCADGLVVSTDEERDLLVREYDAAPERIEVIAPGVDHTVFSPGDGSVVRRRLGLGDDAPLLAFVGRIQPLKGLDVAVGALAALDRTDAHLVVVGGPSGADGDAELARIRALVADLGLADRVHFEAPQAHHRLAEHYRAADVVVVPSRTESFGLVALEAAACGVPVVAADVGGLASVVEHGASGFLVAERDPSAYASAVTAVLADAERLRAGAARRARRFTWDLAAARLRRHYLDVPARELVRCT